MLQLFDDPNSTRIPIMLQEGEEATYSVPFRSNDRSPDWITSFLKMLKEKSKYNYEVPLRFFIPICNNINKENLQCLIHLFTCLLF